MYIKHEVKDVDIAKILLETERGNEISIGVRKTSESGKEKEREREGKSETAR